MAIDRKTQKIFADLLSAAGNIAVYGSLAATAPAYSKDPDAIQNSAYDNGIVPALIGAPGGLASPALEDWNALIYLITRQLAYLFQDGISEWDAGTTYRTDSFCKVGLAVYVSLVDNNTNHVVTDTNFWQTYASTLNNSKGICKAWVTFNGFTGAILDSFNVSSITKTAVGCYLVNFAANMANSNYAFSGSVGVEPGGVYSGGDDNMITGGAPGKAPFKGVNACAVFCYDRGDNGTQDAGSISVIFFGS